jgi:two-component system chemotaxis response regulator CheB
MIKVLIVDDSASMRLFLEQILSADPGIEVVGTAQNGTEALAAVERLAPDVITMDIYMPRMNGLEATRRIMETRPTPIIILSGNLEPEEAMYSFRAMEAGALTALAKPRGFGHPDHEQEISSLVQKVKLMAEVKVVKRWPQQRKAPAAPVPPVMSSAEAQAQPQVVAIGASTGGPVVIQSILAGLSRAFPLPVLIVQHMAPGFIPGFAQWLALTSALPVHIARQSESLLPGHVYIAPDETHMLIKPAGQIALSAAPRENGLRPAVSALFRSVTDVYGKSVIGVLLTGMGWDGVQELLLMKQKGAITIAQDQASSVIYGMPGAAVSLGAATFVLPPDRIVTLLEQLASKGLC